jgi:Family of unknown function (DUF6169)
LSLLTPYNYRRVGQDEVYFSTDFQVEYRVYFTNGSTYFAAFPEISHLVKAFGFEVNDSHVHEVPHDPRVGATITFIVLQFFEQNPEGVLFFIHDGADGKEKGRKRKFDAWFKKIGATKLYKKDAALPFGRISILVSILVRNSHPLLGKISDGLDQLVISVTTKPEELD